VLAGIGQIVHQYTALRLRRRVGDMSHDELIGRKESIRRASFGFDVFRCFREMCFLSETVVLLFLYDVVADVPTHHGFHRFLLVATAQRGQLVRHAVHLLLARFRHVLLDLTIVCLEVLSRNAEYHAEQISALHDLVRESCAPVADQSAPSFLKAGWAVYCLVTGLSIMFLLFCLVITTDLWSCLTTSNCVLHIIISPLPMRIAKHIRADYKNVPWTNHK